MSNLHAPTIPSGPTSAPAQNGQTIQRTMAELQQKKANMEAELRALSGVLDSHGVDMNTPLLTPDGYPRADIDVAQIRTTRSRIIHLRNDYKALMDAIESQIHAHFASIPDEQPARNEQGSDPEPILRDYVAPAPPPEAFAKVNTVVDGSPASLAGLKPDDEIRAFGYVNHSNHDGLKRSQSAFVEMKGKRFSSRYQEKWKEDGRNFSSR
ncbi:unnamed protein product [Parascedosporium putredinis]|uniref:Nas2 N-terminal domain-containing protein n=1 Tax=Parascedosporium putredinis TaxID=1442378 RepID=A0A9P1H4U9_9PEZI|nr:unnamed protein product [Parascedosporium putredinis]CAI7998629.1 unnamed protein product [Parascedosporium putredinis]